MIRGIIKILKFKRKYKKLNAHNHTYAENIFRLERVSVGKETYGAIKVNDWGGDDSKLSIGNYCSIGPNVLFLLGSEHNLNTITTYPLKVKKLRIAEKEATSKGNIILKDDVWIGANVTICSGVTLGQGSVVAAGAVVTKDVPPYAVVAGVPAKILKYRFSEGIIEKLLSVDITEILDKANKDNINMYYENITLDSLEEILKKI